MKNTLNPLYFKETFLVPSTRLQGFDYSSLGYYFITICTKDKIQSLGTIECGIWQPNGIGKICTESIKNIPSHIPNAKIHIYTVMPNHIHLLIEITSAPYRRDGIHPVSEQEHRKFNNTSQVKTASLSILQNNKTHPEPRDGMYPVSTKTISIPNIIGTFKARVSRYANKRKIPFSWQPRYHDHIIRSEKEFYAITKYIEDNVGNWEKDEYN